jgi:hypothetical protein
MAPQSHLSFLMPGLAALAIAGLWYMFGVAIVMRLIGWV